jgi:hypothetical protein
MAQAVHQPKDTEYGVVSKLELDTMERIVKRRLLRSFAQVRLIAEREVADALQSPPN